MYLQYNANRMDLCCLACYAVDLNFDYHTGNRVFSRHFLRINNVRIYIYIYSKADNFENADCISTYLYQHRNMVSQTLRISDKVKTRGSAPLKAWSWTWHGDDREVETFWVDTRSPELRRRENRVRESESDERQSVWDRNEDLTKGQPYFRKFTFYVG